MTAAFPTLLTWTHDGTELFEQEVAKLDADAAGEPSLLPGWTRAHVITHVARNADALVNLLTWARTGVENPMYASPEQRNADIERGAGRTAADLRADLLEADRRLADAIANLPEQAWSAQVRSARGRDIPASEVPWMRIREVWIHAADLGCGTRFTDFPAELVDALLDDAAGAFSAREDGPALLLDPTDRERQRRIGPQPGVTVSGTASDLLAWLLGREAGSELRADTRDGRPPALPAWL